MKIPQYRDVVDSIKQRVEIVQVIGEHVKLDRHNKALCPFHQEKTPSFSVNAEGQYFYCFGCSVGGDVIRFLELYEHKPFAQVLAELAVKAGIPFEGLAPRDMQSLEEERVIPDVLTETARYYHGSLTQEANEYLTKERGLSNEIISQFQIGYAQGGLREHLTKHCKFSEDVCLKAGVLKKTNEGQIRDFFFQRLTFPNPRRGRIVHLSGRRLDGQDPKYLHLPGEVRYLYHEDALYYKEILIAEGIPDCLSSIQAGFPAVAVLGSQGFKPEYLAKFHKAEKIYICLDGDSAGDNGTIKIAEIIGDRSKIVSLPRGLDINEYFKDHTKEDFEELLVSAVSFIKFQISSIPSNLDKTQLPDCLEPILRQLAKLDSAKAEAYLGYEIKPRFSLKNDDIDGYRKQVAGYRKKDVKEANPLSSVQRIQPTYSAQFEGLVDLVGHEGSIAFLIKGEDSLSIVTQIENDGRLNVPPPIDQVPWLLPRGNEVLNFCEVQEALPQTESNAALYDDLLAYHRSISELPGDEYYDLLVAWDIHTYLLDGTQYSPIICLFAVPERGKSRTGKGLIHVARRGIHVESLRDAYLVRVANDLQASLFFDVKDIWRKAEKNGTEDILLHRFERGAKVPRVLFPDKGPHQDIVYYKIFGPTIIGTNEGVHKILETRAITINMPETNRQFENEVTPELALPLKERLTAFRARYLGITLSDIPKPAPGRLGDILKPLQQVIRLVRPEREPLFLKLVRELQAEKLIDKADSLEAQILRTLVELKDQVERGILPVKAIADKLNDDKPEKAKITYQRVGRRLNAMGFKKGRTGDGASAVLWDECSIGRMVETYGLKQTSEKPVSSEMPFQMADDTDVSGNSDVFQGLLNGGSR